MVFLAFSLNASALDLSDIPAAEKNLETLASQWEEQFRKDQEPASEIQLAFTYQALGIVKRQAGKPNQALELLTTACEIIERLTPASLADPLEAKALALQDLGKLEESEQSLRNVLTIRRQKDGSPGLARSLDHLALNLLQQGQYPEARLVLDEAMAEAPENDNALHASLLTHSARLHHTLGSYARSAEILKQALAVPFDDPELALTIRSQLGLSQLRLGKFDEGYAATLEAAEDAKKLYSSRPFLAVPYLNNLGAIALSQHDAETADLVFSEAVGTIQATFGLDHPSLISPLNNLGVAKQTLGDYFSAATYFHRAAILQEKHLPSVHLRVAETQRNLACNALLSGDQDAKQLIEKATATGLALLNLLIKEGTERERLNFLGRFDLVSLPCATGDAESIANVLIASKARLFDALLNSANTAKAPDWQAIQSTLSTGSVFVDVCLYTTVSETPEIRYGAIVIAPHGPPQWIPLGSDSELESWLGKFYERLSWRSAKMEGKSPPPPALKLRPILRSLHKQFWAPFSAVFPPGTSDIAFSPDARMHYLPLAALLDQNFTLLSKSLSQVTTVSSARDMLNPPPEKSLSASPWAVLTISDFPKTPRTETTDPLINLLSGLQNIPGTEAEAEAIKRIAPEKSVFFHDEQTSEQTIENLKAETGVIHLGCHAFFLGGDSSLKNLPVDFDDNADLLTSGGLILYNGAKRRVGAPPYSNNDDLLFPSEIAELSLEGTRLVTLSSCDSGAGTSVSGEGLVGMRRAFAIAGAREILVALWPVSDSSTPGFMDRFYRLALASDRPAQALWQAQGELLSVPPEDTEAFEIAVIQYAPFILSQNAPLETGNSIKVEPITSHLHQWLIAASLLPILLFIGSRIKISG